jgi:hypothetical protein
MNEVPSNFRSPTDTIVMDFGWGPDSYAASYGTSNFAYPDFSTPPNGKDQDSRYARRESYCTNGIRIKNHSFSFADATSAFTNHDPADYKHDLVVTTIYPMTLSSEPGPSTTSSTTSSHDSAQASSATPNTTPTEISETSDKEIEFIQSESVTTSRARYATNQRHAKARNSQQASNVTNATTEATTQAAEKKQVLRDKNKVAAAKSRQRQRKQAENIRVKGGRLSETNTQLKSLVQELRGELNGLRAYALEHGDCDDRLALYNQVQAKRVMAEYYSACGGLAEP